MELCSALNAAMRSNSSAFNSSRDDDDDGGAAAGAAGAAAGDGGDEASDASLLGGAVHFVAGEKASHWNPESTRRGRRTRLFSGSRLILKED
jgi:hypothetical protein